MSVGVACGYHYTGAILRTFIAGGITPRFSIQLAKACPPFIHYDLCFPLSSARADHYPLRKGDPCHVHYTFSTTTDNACSW